MDWLDMHSGSVQAVVTVVLVALTGYYAWFSRQLVRETRMTLQAAARAQLSARMDRIGEMCIRDPQLFGMLDEDATDAFDARFFFANMFLGIIEEAHLQYTLEHSMPVDDWNAWQATADSFLHRKYFDGYWERVKHTYAGSFRTFVDERIHAIGRPPRP